MLGISNLATATALNAKINGVKNKVPNITNLATITALTVFENTMPNVSNLVKKTDYNTKNYWNWKQNHYWSWSW